MSKVFVDTNVLLYCLDRHDRKKQKRCRQLLRDLQQENRAAISTQVLQEFYVAATRKLGVEPLAAKGMLKSFTNMEVVVVTPRTIEDAVDCSILNQISFWDALVVVSAESAECEELMSEDLNHGQVINGVQVRSPF